MTLLIRPSTPSDELAVSHICLVTADAGKSAEPLHIHPELPGLVYAVPYIHLPTTFGFVLQVEETREVVGYVVGTRDSREYEKVAREQWWPPIQERYPLDGPGKLEGKEGDEHYFKLVHDMHVAPDKCHDFSPAHIHINILEPYRGKGWGRRMIGKAVELLRGEGFTAVWLGIDPRNEEAKKFYLRIGFKLLEGEGFPEGSLGLSFVDWQDA
ncbi:hypothetical protein JAAARDRAFT_28259 [Jaapia argillacea MUCL 33604]|uniref:N-acetyltransferase domain-containing protein n=1 Tax=Jaapia argillacea MUCL 33604 TaxID=933084 RepID=A0A067QCD9_9AGAM|nr:hypothetical protein JAAARDRAFT_28259 [Jaapia argillacea MUCL 33604]